jgi:hypothetical protein
VNQATTKGTGVGPTTTSTSISASASTTAQPNSSSASSSDLRSRNRNQGLPTNGLIGGMNGQQGKSAVSNQGLGYGQSATRRRESLDSEMSVSWSGSEGEREGEEQRRNKETRGVSVNSSGMSNSIGSTNASVSGRSVGSRVVGRNRSRGRTEKHSGLMMMSGSAKGKKRAGGGKLGMPTKHAVSQTSLSTSQPQSQGSGNGDVKSGTDDQARVSGKGKEKEKQTSATVSTNSTSGSSGSRDAIQGQAQVVAERKREGEQTVTRKSMQHILAKLGSVIADEGSSNGTNGLSSSPSSFGGSSIHSSFFSLYLFLSLSLFFVQSRN